MEDTTLDGGKLLEGLNTKRRNLGPAIFEAQYQNEVKLLEGHIIKPKWISEFYYECRAQDIEDFYKGKRLFLASDLAIGKDISSDEFAVIMIGIDRKDGHIYIGPYYNGHLTFHQQTTKLVTFWERWKEVSVVVRLGIEKNAYQAAQVESVNEMARIGAIGIHTSKDKRTRLEAVSGLFEAGQVHLWKSHADELIEQLLAFPSTSVKDDILDAMVMAIELSRKYVMQPHGVRIHG
jgi:predicted phage terminase large subunit-like protein